MQIEFTASPEIRAAIADLGRTEDVHFSPDNRRLAIAGMIENKILVLDVWIERRGGSISVEMNDFQIVRSAAFNQPHGLFWMDDTTLIVANRHGDVPIIRIPKSNDPVRQIVAPAIATIRSDDTDRLDAPGSVSVRRLGAGLYEALICNNDAHTISRHLIDEQSGLRIASSEILIAEGFDIPDSVAHSPSGRWIAVSNHNHNCVHLYRNDPNLRPDSRPIGILRGVNYPHGLRFSPDERSILVADAGAPFVHIYGSSDGDWSGERQPSHSLQVIDDESFKRGRSDPQEGGPKGVDLNRDGSLLVASCEEQPIVFFDIREHLQVTAGGDAPGKPATLEAGATTKLLVESLSTARTELGALRGALATAQRTLAEQTALAEKRRGIHESAETAFARALQLHQSERVGMTSRLRAARQNEKAAVAKATDARRELRAMRNSRMWRLTAPLRKVLRLLRGRR